VTHSKKRILVFTSTFPRWKNDAEPPFVLNLTKQLTKEFQCIVIAPHHKEAAIHEVIENITVKRFRYFISRFQTLTYNGGILARLKQNRLRSLQIPFFLLAELFSLIKTLKSEKPHLIHAHWLIPQGLVAVIARKITRNPAKILCTIHGGDLYSLQGKVLNAIKKYILNNVDCITVVSNTMKSELTDMGIDNDKVFVIPMGVDLLKTFKRNSQITRKPHSLLFVGRLVEKKGITYLIEAMQNIVSQFPSTTLSIVGSGPDKIMLQTLTRQLDLDNNIKFLGNIENQKLVTIYNQHQVVIFPSIIANNGDQEGFGLVLVEAIGCECAVISTDLEPMKDIITHNQDAIIVKQKSPDAITHAVKELFTNDNLAGRIAKHGRQQVVKYFDWNVIGEKYIRIIKQTVNQTEPPRTIQNKKTPFDRA